MLTLASAHSAPPPQINFTSFPMAPLSVAGVTGTIASLKTLKHTKSARIARVVRIEAIATCVAQARIRDLALLLGAFMSSSLCSLLDK